MVGERTRAVRYLSYPKEGSRAEVVDARRTGRVGLGELQRLMSGVAREYGRQWYVKGFCPR